jgi:hypothetical protein
LSGGARRPRRAPCRLETNLINQSFPLRREKTLPGKPAIAPGPSQFR